MKAHICARLCTVQGRRMLHQSHLINDSVRTVVQYYFLFLIACLTSIPHLLLQVIELPSHLALMYPSPLSYLYLNQE